MCKYSEFPLLFFFFEFFFYYFFFFILIKFVLLKWNSISHVCSVDLLFILRTCSICLKVFDLRSTIITKNNSKSKLLYYVASSLTSQAVYIIACVACSGNELPAGVGVELRNFFSISLAAD